MRQSAGLACVRWEVRQLDVYQAAGLTQEYQSRHLLAHRDA